MVLVFTLIAWLIARVEMLSRRVGNLEAKVEILCNVVINGKKRKGGESEDEEA